MTEEAEECFQLPLQEMSYKKRGGTQGKQSFYEAKTQVGGENLAERYILQDRDISS